MLCRWVIHVIRCVPTEAMESLREGSRERGLRGICCEGFGISRVRPLTPRLVRRFESEGFAACAAAARGG